MMEERLEALLWEEIEGDLSAEKRRALDDLLAGDTEARAARERLSMLNRELSSLGAVEPPAELRPRIREAIRSRTRPPRESTLARFRAAFESLSAGRARFAYVVTGIFVGVVAALVLSGGFEATAPMDRGSLYGAVNLAGDEWLEIELPEGRGVLRLRRQGEELSTALVSSASLEIRVERTKDGVVIGVSAESQPILERRLDWEEIPGS